MGKDYSSSKQSPGAKHLLCLSRAGCLHPICLERFPQARLSSLRRCWAAVPRQLSPTQDGQTGLPPDAEGSRTPQGAWHFWEASDPWSMRRWSNGAARPPVRRPDVSQQLGIKIASAEFMRDTRSLGQSEQINSSAESGEFIAGLYIVTSVCTLQSSICSLRELAWIKGFCLCNCFSCTGDPA